MATLPMPQPHSQLRSFSACISVVFWAALRVATPATAVSSPDFIQPAGNSPSALYTFAGAPPEGAAAAGAPAAGAGAAAVSPSSALSACRGPTSRPIRKPVSRPTASAQGQMLGFVL